MTFTFGVVIGICAVIGAEVIVFTGLIVWAVLSERDL